ncbi:type IX secretion system outer membrane channel protein PorV [Mucilaginibacter sp. HMF5004]|uniref:type IX secretion system outer membrane channel protein PorV n=1 Tax=Mucilaginibacter rivuli TaxID=2857527 RepID=UPI001C5FCAA3|nr:type IX secretion system outer membrane channel protein PorV [Mucilaginibacter rivuli]MBW4890238.1 type IX secretion system outer membrane channel protein PorV [Mucilaginibacter rivuli]
MKILNLFIKTGTCALAFITYLNANGQTVTPGTNSNGSSTNAITTAVPFLTISPNARSGGMGDAGVALAPEVNDSYWNPSKLAFLEEPTSLSLSYSPWLRNLIPDINLAYLSFAKRTDERTTIGASLRYFNLGTIELFDANQNPQGTYQPNEFSIDATLARKFGNDFSLGITARYIYSGLTNGISVNSQQTNSASAVAADVSLFYRKPVQQFGNDALFAFGTNISNIGTKISYVEGGKKYFLPTNLKLGVANTMFLDSENQLTLTLDINKLLVPTPPIRDSNGNILSGSDDNKSIVSGIFGSFTDAPGGLGEELKEISYAAGAEYMYAKLFALRAGYFYENPDKGNRQYFSLGAGFKYSDFSLDFSYLVASQKSSPLANTLRFTLGYNFGKK